MCGCNNDKFFVNSPHLKIYTIMANYEVKKEYKGSATSFSGGYFVRWGNATQDELAHIYENIDNGKSFIDKTDKKDEPKKTNKKKSSKAKD
jgi:hypothetical protein